MLHSLKLLYSRVMPLAAMALWLSACATPQAKAPPETIENIRTIGVSSALGHDFNYISYGFTIFSNEKRMTTVPEWRWDESAIETLKSELSNRFSISTVEIDKEEILRAPKAPAEKLAQKIYAAVRKPAQTSDAYLIIVRGDDRYLNESHYVEGFGVFRQDRVIRYVPQYAVYAVFDLLLIDGRSGQLLAASEGRVACPECIGPDSVAFRRIEGSSAWPADFISLLGQYRPQLEKAQADLIADSISWTLKKMGLAR